MLSNQNSSNKNWLVVLTILKNISQWEGLSHILWKIKKCSKPPTRKSVYWMLYQLSPGISPFNESVRGKSSHFSGDDFSPIHQLPSSYWGNARARHDLRPWLQVGKTQMWRQKACIIYLWVYIWYIRYLCISVYQIYGYIYVCLYIIYIYPDAPCVVYLPTKLGDVWGKCWSMFNTCSISDTACVYI